MMFSSVIFLFFFLPLALAAYVLTPGKYRNLSLVLISLIFLGYALDSSDVNA